ncbi:hypothetical protein Hypma_014092 [Hypsizygus marmoreus]|uniref:Uncharacterized protein n=1 Tax=Hypsizygus marmoreus TaxID=39966 RepID=A0A369KEB9_HYPMA|nr:hypothetical protein Hypma_014092 [Hypsizygus marmoreus]
MSERRGRHYSLKVLSALTEFDNLRAIATNEDAERLGKSIKEKRALHRVNQISFRMQVVDLDSPFVLGSVGGHWSFGSIAWATEEALVTTTILAGMAVLADITIDMAGISFDAMINVDSIAAFRGKWLATERRTALLAFAFAAPAYFYVCAVLVLVSAIVVQGLSWAIHNDAGDVLFLDDDITGDGGGGYVKARRKQATMAGQTAWSKDGAEASSCSFAAG